MTTWPTASRTSRTTSSRPSRPLELFFDLVFVFAITQVTRVRLARPDVDAARSRGSRSSPRCGGRGSPTCGWATPRAPTRGPCASCCCRPWARMLIASLAVPHAFGDDGVIFGVAYLAVRVLHLGAYAIVSRDDPQLRYVVVRMATTMLPASMLIVVAGALDGTRAGPHVGRRRWRSTTAASSRAAPRAGASWPATSPSATAWSSSSPWASRSSRSASARRAWASTRASSSARCWAWPWPPRCGGRTSTSSRWSPRACCAQAPPDEQVRIARDSLHLPAPADGRRDRPLRARGQEDAGARRRRPRGGAGGRAVRRRGALPGRAERAQAPQHRLVQPPAAGGRGRAGRAGADGDGDARAAGAGARGGRRVLALIAYETVRYADTRDRVRHG